MNRLLNSCLDEYYDINVISKLTTHAILELLVIVSHGSILKFPALNGYLISPACVSLLCVTYIQNSVFFSGFP